MTRDEAWALLPWLATDRLTPDEVRAVLDRLATEPALRRELRYLSELERAVEHPALDGDLPEPAPERLLRRIDALADPAPRGAAEPGWLRRPAPSLRPVWVPGALLVALVFLLVAPGGEPAHHPDGAAAFQTLSTAGAVQAAAGAATIRLAVAPEMSVAELGALLDRFGAVLVQGPAGASETRAPILLTVEAPAASGAGGGPVHDAVLERIRRAPGVLLAERAHGAL